MKKLFKRLLCMVAFSILTVVCAHADKSVVLVKTDEPARQKVSRAVHKKKSLKFRVPYGRQAVIGCIEAFDEGRRFAVLVLENNILDLKCGRNLRVVDDKESLMLGKIEAIANIPETRASALVVAPAPVAASASESAPAPVADALMEDDASIDSADSSPMTPPSVVPSSRALPNLPLAAHGVRRINVTDEYGRVIRLEVAPGTNVQELTHMLGARTGRYSI